MSRDEKKAMVDHLGTYKKKKVDWDIYRLAIADDLLQKWGMVLNMCRANGFVKPDVFDGKLQWSQILSNTRSRGNNDKCTVCSNSITKDTCAGKTIYKKMQQQFVPCWIGGN